MRQPGSRTRQLQFLRELHFIEAGAWMNEINRHIELQFLRELHFIEARARRTAPTASRSCSSFGNCTSLKCAQVETFVV